jgi:hypothetical protein
MFGFTTGLPGKTVAPFCWSGIKIRTFGEPGSASRGADSWGRSSIVASPSDRALVINAAALAVAAVLTNSRLLIMNNPFAVERFKVKIPLVTILTSCRKCVPNFASITSAENEPIKFCLATSSSLRFYLSKSSSSPFSCGGAYRLQRLRQHQPTLAARWLTPLASPQFFDVVIRGH